MSFPFDPASVPYMHIAFGACVLGLFSGGQLALRVTCLIATLFALVFWGLDPAATDLVTGGLLALAFGANAAWLRRRFTARRGPAETPVGAGPDIAAARAALSHVPDRLFAELMRLGHRGAARHETLLTAMGRRPDALWLVLNGAPRVSRGPLKYDRAAPCFVGEVSWLTGAPCSATVHLRVGAHYIAWPRDALQEAMRADPELGEALEAQIAHDMARRMVEKGPAPKPDARLDRRGPRYQKVDRTAWGMGQGGAG